MDYSGKEQLIDSDDIIEIETQLEQRLEQTEKQLHASQEAWLNSIKKLKRSRREFMTIFDSVPAMIWYRDRQGRILRVNQCAANSVGRLKEDLIGKNYYELFPDGAARSRQQDLEVIETGHPLRHQIRKFESFDGTIHWATVDRIPLTDKRLNAIVGVMVFAQDITEKKIAQEQLINAKKEIELRNEQLKAYASKAKDSARKAHLSNKAKSEILASSSHDLRTPMNAIIGFLDLLRTTEIDDEQIEYVDMINKSATSLLSLINDILDYSKLEAGKLNIQITDCNVSDFTREIEATMAPGARQKGLEFNVQIDSEVPETFPTDPVRLKQCMINLIGNAIKFTKEGHITIDVRPVLKDGQPSIQFGVEDTGVGIAKDKQELIFKAYSQAESTTDRVFGGTGLGLSITKKLADLLEGHISIESEPGKGSVFSIILPLTPKEN